MRTALSRQKKKKDIRSVWLNILLKQAVAHNQKSTCWIQWLVF